VERGRHVPPLSAPSGAPGTHGEHSSVGPVRIVGGAAADGCTVRRALTLVIPFLAFRALSYEGAYQELPGRVPLCEYLARPEGRRSAGIP
jgi:hypothetical protein